MNELSDQRSHSAMEDAARIVLHANDSASRRESMHEIEEARRLVKSADGPVRIFVGEAV